MESGLVAVRSNWLFSPSSIVNKIPTCYHLFVPSKQEGEKFVPSAENLHTLKGNLFAAWEHLPLEHQATTTLLLLEKMLESDFRAWVRQTISLRWPLETELLPTAFTLIQITREDLVEAHFHEDEIAQLTDEDLKTIAQTMRDHYVHDVFWPELAYVTEGFLEARNKHNLQQRLEEASAADADFQAWMSQIDKLTWTTAGCSIYDLPDCNFRSMFAGGISPGEVVNQVLEEAGVDFLE